MWEVVKDGDLEDGEKKGLVEEFGTVLGLDFESGIENKELRITDEVKELLDQRQKARESKDWAEADRLRDLVKDLGFGIRDVGGEQELIKI